MRHSGHGHGGAFFLFLAFFLAHWQTFAIVALITILVSFVRSFPRKVSR